MPMSMSISIGLAHYPTVPLNSLMLVACQ